MELAIATGLTVSMLCCTAIVSIDLKRIQKQLDQIEKKLQKDGK